MKFLYNFVVLLFLVNSCQSSKEAKVSGDLENGNKLEKAILYSGSYNISQIGDNADLQAELTINFDTNSNRVMGFAGCNRFMGSYTTQGNTIAFHNIATTRKFCEDAINSVENNFLDALNVVNAFSLENGELQLLNRETPVIKANRSQIISKNDIVKNSYKTAVVYETSTRGNYEYISISEADILISTDRNLKDIANHPCDAKEWEALNTLINLADLELFQKLEAPTEERFSDKVPEAFLTINMGDVQYITPPFDHGHPPKAIEALVNKVLSIRQKAAKQ